MCWLNGKKTPIFSVALLLAAVICSIVSCGYYMPPIPPEDLAPEGVRNLKVDLTEKAVIFSWNSSEKDLRGKPLKDLKGYKVYKAKLEYLEETLLDEDRFEKIADLKDTHLETLRKLRKKAEAKGKSTRKLKAPKEETTFSVKDTKVEKGGIYIYRIVPYNTELESEKAAVFRITFFGPKSVVERIS
ncbi:MAG: hypothetical protein D6808_02265 [Candidatus Dadabacteria bacterium]|nr:MAG: hypothetical protein D6808_02265 [Candidatus Dadabacteria bacterium]